MRMIAKVLAVGATLAAGIGVSAVAHAQGQPPHEGPCKEDRAKFCPDVERGGGRVMQCLQTHASELSESCSAALANHQGRHHHRRGASDAGM